MVYCLLGRSRHFPGLPPSWLWHTSPLRAVFTQPTPVLSLGSDLWSPSLSSQPPPTPAGEQTNLSGWWVLVGTYPLCRNLSALLSAPLLLCSPPWLWSFPLTHPPSPPVKDLHRVWKLFLLHSFLPEVHVPFVFFCLCFFFCPTHLCGDFLAFWEVWGLLPAFSRCSAGVVPHVDVFLMYLWGGSWSPHLTPLPSWRSPHHNILIVCNFVFILCIYYTYFYLFIKYIKCYYNKCFVRDLKRWQGI